MVISKLFNSLIFMYTALPFHETVIVNEAQVPPTGLLCEVKAGEMVTGKEYYYHFL